MKKRSKRATGGASLSPAEDFLRFPFPFVSLGPFGSPDVGPRVRQNFNPFGRRTFRPLLIDESAGPSWEFSSSQKLQNSLPCAQPLHFPTFAISRSFSRETVGSARTGEEGQSRSKGPEGSGDICRRWRQDQSVQTTRKELHQQPLSTTSSPSLSSNGGCPQNLFGFCVRLSSQSSHQPPPPGLCMTRPLNRASGDIHPASNILAP